MLRLIVILVCLMNVSAVPTLVCRQGQKTGNCHCDIDQRRGYHLNCPSYLPRDKVLDILYRKDQFIQVKCVPGINAEDVLPQLEGLSLGSVHTVKFVSCPEPREPISHLLDTMGVATLRKLSFTNVQRKTEDQGADRMFSNMTDLQILEFKHHGRLNVTDNFFENMPKLKAISLSGIKNLTLHSDCFQRVQNLVSLSITSSRLTKIEKPIFKNLKKLTDLNLHGNAIEDIEPHALDDLENLKMLNLGKNSLKYLPENILSNQPHLEVLDIGYNQFESFPEKFLSGKKKLKQFIMLVNGECYSYKKQCENKTTILRLPEQMFDNSSIEFIKILHVPVEKIPHSFLDGCSNLKSFIFQGGFIKDIPEHIFRDTKRLEKLDFVNNHIENVPKNLFQGLSKLSSIRFKFNKLTELDMEIFSGLNETAYLHFSDNLITKIIRSDSNKMHLLQEIDFSNNKLTFLQIVDILRTLNIIDNERTVKVNFADNKLEVNISSELSKIIKLLTNSHNINLQGNMITGDVEVNELALNMFKTNLILDLSKNRIRRLKGCQKLNLTNNVKILFSENPYVCDCHSSEIKEILKQTPKKLILNTLDFQCGSGNATNILTSLESMPHSSLVCPRPNSCLPGCECTFNMYYKTTSIDCSSLGLTIFPENLPIRDKEAEAVHLYFEENDIENLSGSLEKLHSNASSDYHKISKMFFTGNKIAEIDASTLPRGLQYLCLDRNEIRYISNQTLQLLTQNPKMAVRLAGNPFECNCQNIDLQKFLQNNQMMVEDYRNITVNCGDEKSHLFSMAEEDICAALPLLAMIFPALLLLIGLVFVLLLHLFYRDTIAIWLFSKSWGKLFFSEDLVDCNKAYDVFLSYSHHDASYVESTLLPGLESKTNPVEHQYRCLIHTRDWLVGEMIPDQILTSVSSSRRTLVVLSKEYMQATWTKMEFRAAHQAAMKENTQRVIVVVRGKLPVREEMDEDLQKYIQSNTFIGSEDPWFWEKLRFALPRKTRKRKIVQEEIIK